MGRADGAGSDRAAARPDGRGRALPHRCHRRHRAAAAAGGGRPHAQGAVLRIAAVAVHELAAIAVDRRAGGQALEIAERAKARAITELLQRNAGGPAAGGGPDPFRLQDAETLVRDGSIAAIEYVVSADRVFVITITRESTGLVVNAVPIAADRRASQRWPRDSTPASRAAISPTPRTARAYAGAARSRAGADRRPGQLVIVPDGPLWEVPFQALPDRKAAS